MQQDGTVIEIDTRFDDQVPDGMEDDDDIIDYFLENNTDWEICEFY
jgi:hypothetical protein